jgi:predicted NBD/HSP70 family sugar kinase
MPREFILIGIDGGATKVSGWTIRIEPPEPSFSLGTVHFEREYSEYPTFQATFAPVDLTVQLQEWQSGQIRLTPEEERQGTAYMEACADVISAIATHYPAQPLVVGIGMPGLKTADGRGVAVLANGPRLPYFADLVEQRLEAAGVSLAAPIAKLGSDADYCGIGEEYATKGLFADVQNAYYLGGGTGAADALKLRGKLVPLDRTKAWLAKTWELVNERGQSLERFASSGGIQAVYSQYSGHSPAHLNRERIYPPQIAQRAQAGEPAAVRTFADISRYLAELLFERITTIYSGWHGWFSFRNPDRPALHPDHEYRGTLLDRIIIGQRLGELWEHPAAEAHLKQPLLDHLSRLLVTTPRLDETARKHYLRGNRFNPQLIAVSRLREAPALGAGIDAYLSWQRANMP